MEEIKYLWSTKDLYMAAFVITSGFEMDTPLVTASGQFHFRFKGDPIKLELARFSYTNDGLIPAGKFAQNIKSLKHLTHNTLLPK